MISARAVRAFSFVFLFGLALQTNAAKPDLASDCVSILRDGPSAADFALAACNQVIANTSEADEDAKTAEAYYARGMVNQMLGKHKLSSLDFDEAVRLAPDNLYYLEMQAHGRLLTEDHEGMLKSTARMLELDPGKRSALSKRAYAFGRLGRFEDALKIYDRLIEATEDVSGSYVSRGHIHSNLGDYGAAIADFDRAISQDPMDGNAIHSRGWAWARAGDGTAAARDWMKAIELEGVRYRGFWNARLRQYGYNTASANATLSGRDLQMALIACALNPNCLDKK